MIVGIYSWGKKPLGYATCRCLHCDQRTTAHAHRSFLVLHPDFIPLLLLGIRKVWTCDECGESPPTGNQNLERSVALASGAGARCRVEMIA